MASVTINAGVLAAPTAGAARAQVLRYVESLLDWRRLLDEPRWVGIYLSERTSEILFDDGLYPLRNHLRPLFAATGVIDYDFNTVAQVAEALLRLTPTFEEYFQVDDVEVSDLVANPNLIAMHVLPALVENLSRCAVLIAVLRCHCPYCVINHALLVKPWDQAGLVQIQARIRAILHSRADLANVPEDPNYFHGSVQVCQSFRELILATDEIAILVAAHNQNDIHVAVRIALYKSRLQRSRDPEWEETAAFSLGAHFFETAQQTGTMNVPGRADKVLRAMVETIDDLNLKDTHWLRTGRGANDPQRAEGAAKAWRRDIDYEYHLHYWKYGDNSVRVCFCGYP